MVKVIFVEIVVTSQLMDFIKRWKTYFKISLRQLLNMLSLGSLHIQTIDNFPIELQEENRTLAKMDEIGLNIRYNTIF